MSLGDNDHAVYLTTAGDEIEAGTLESLLNSNNIPVLRKYREAGAYLSIYMGNTIAGIDIYVPSKLFSAASELINKGDEQDFAEDVVQSEEENELLSEEKRIQHRRSFRAWIILLFFVSGIGTAIIFYLIKLIAIIFKW